MFKKLTKAITSWQAQALALTLLPPVWFVYIMLGGLLAFLAYAAYDLLLVIVNYTFVIPECGVVDLLAKSTPIKLTSWTTFQYIDIGIEPAQFGQAIPGFNQVRLACSVLCYLGAVSTVLYLAHKRGDLKLSVRKEEKPQ